MVLCSYFFYTDYEQIVMNRLPDRTPGRELAESYGGAGTAVGSTDGCINGFHPISAADFTQLGVVQVGDGFFG